MVVPFSAGSSSDTIARIVAVKMGERLGQQVVVENRVGGSTIIGTDAVAKSAPDGYTLELANTTTHAASAALNATLPFDPVKDFAPVAMIGVSPFVLIGATQVAAPTLEGFRCAGESQARLAQLRLGRHRHARASRRRIVQAQGRRRGHARALSRQRAVDDRPDAGPHRSLGQHHPADAPAHPRGQAARARHHEREAQRHRCRTSRPWPRPACPGCEAALWTAIVVPAGVPADIIKRLNAAVLAAVATPEIQQALTIQGVDPEPGPPEAVSERIKADIVKWKDVVTAAKITGGQ